MARKFNLQPWRQKVREAQKKQFVTITSIVAVGALALCGGYYWLANGYIEKQTQAIQLLKNKINELQKTKKEIELTKQLNDEVIKQIAVIQDLQNYRSLTVQILNFLAEKTPNDIFLRSVSYSNNTLTINGTAQNQGSVSAFAKELKSFPLFYNVFPVEIKQATNNPRYTVTQDTAVRTFILTANVRLDANGSSTQ